MNPAIREAEAAITQAMIDGSLPNHRLLNALRHLDEGRFCMPLTMVRQALASSSAQHVSEGLCAVLADLHVRQRMPVADLQLLAIGIYRLIWRVMVRLDTTVSLDDLRQLSAAQAAHACYGFTFGFRLWPLPIPSEWCVRMQARLRRFMRTEGLDQTWCDPRPLPLTSPLVTMCDPQLSPSANAIRNTFMAEVFIDALSAAPSSAPSELLVSEVLFAADRHPERVRFLRHLSQPQARFRLRQLALATMALHHQEVTTRPLVTGRLALESVITCLLSPFVSLRSWVRVNRQRLIIPLVRETPAGDALFVAPTTEAAAADAPAPDQSSVYPKWSTARCEVRGCKTGAHNIDAVHQTGD